jgi:hypothetical protein
MAEKVAKLMDLEKECVEIIIDNTNKYKEILKQLDFVKQPYRKILEKRYIDGKKLVTIASEENYNYEYVRRANGIALNKFDEAEKYYKNITKKVTKSYTKVTKSYGKLRS